MLANKPKPCASLSFYRPAQKRSFCFRAVFNDYTGYGIHACYIARSFMRYGYAVKALPVRLPEDEGKAWTGNPDVIKVIQKEAGRNGNELFLTFVDATVDKGQWLYTMYETTKMPRSCLNGINQANVIIVPSVWCQENFNAQGVHVPMFVVPLGVNLDLFSPAAKKPELCIFGSAGNISLSVPLRKNMDMVVAAFREAFPDQDDVRLKLKVQPDCQLVLTDDPRVEVIRQRFTEAEMADWYRSLTVYISTAHAEAFGQMNLQAMACGVPVMCCAFGGVIDYHSELHGYNVDFTMAQPVGCYHDTGLWADPDMDSLIEQMRRVYHNRSEARQKGVLAEQVAQRYDWDSVNLKLEQVLKQTDFWTGRIQRSKSKPTGLRMLRDIQFEPCTHRSGWNAVLNRLHAEVHDSLSPVFLDDYLEKNFSWDWYQTTATGIIPYRRPWAGFIHNPVLTPYPFDIKASTGIIFSTGCFVESLDYCRGIFTLSEALARDVRKLTNGIVPVESFLHPTEFTNKLFDLNRFLKSPRILHLGWWLRRFASFALLPVNMPKYGLMAQNKFPKRLTELRNDMSLLRVNRWSRLQPTEVTFLDYVPNEEFDDWLASSVVFIDLYASSANNTIIECMVRNTPVLVNPLDAVVEYLGPDYPLYYHTLEEAAEKASKERWLRLATDYLASWPLKQELRFERFIARFKQSKIVQEITNS